MSLGVVKNCGFRFSLFLKVETKYVVMDTVKNAAVSLQALDFSPLLQLFNKCTVAARLRKASQRATSSEANPTIWSCYANLNHYSFR